jgi:amino acid transporter
MVLVVGGWFTTLFVVGVMSAQGRRSHASNDFVWKTWENNTGYAKNGLVFILGMLNGSFAIGTPDCTIHMAEEIKKYLPRTMLPIDRTANFYVDLRGTYRRL